MIWQNFMHSSNKAFFIERNYILINIMNFSFFKEEKTKFKHLPQTKKIQILQNQGSDMQTIFTFSS